MFRFTRLTLSVAYFLNILLLFLLLFEDKVQLPALLQVSGRMHPLVLHFPLVLLFAGIVLEYLATRKDFQHDAVRNITSGVILLFALSAAVTALFGFFLYKEGTYLGPDVTLHKWLGAAVSWMALVILELKKRSLTWYRITLGVSAACMIITGHVGAEVTHGQGFLTEPLRKQSTSLLQIENADSALVFRDVIQPILNEKCVSCHNPNRAKGDLVLSDYESLLKGGENRDGVVTGHADRSLLYKYIVLPMDDSLHMPPKDKLQLDREEIRLIGWWINTGAENNIKYVNLPKTDSIHTIMLAKFHPKSGLDLLDIPFVDHEVIESLNNPYRTVQQIAATQPYIAVFLGSKKDLNAGDLTELGKVASQVVSVDLGNSEVADGDLKSVATFTHLQRLYLQNTKTGDEGVKNLRDLQYLDLLNLSGTKVSDKTLDEISRWKHLKKLYIYNTSVTSESLASLKKSHPDLEVFNTQIDLTDSVYNAELTPPVVKIDSSFFRRSASVEVKLSRGKVKFFYTLDGQEPTSESTLYNEPFRVGQSATLKMKATMTGWKDSKVVSFALMKIGRRPDIVKLETKPDPKYSGKLDSTLVDGKPAAGFNRGEKEYLGFISADPEVLFEFKEPRELSRLSVSFLQDNNNGVFAPSQVEVWAGNDIHHLEKVSRVDNPLPANATPPNKVIMTLSFPEQSVRVVRFKAKRIASLPPWPSIQKDAKRSIFVDEISFD